MPATKNDRNSEPTYVASVMAYGKTNGYVARLERDMLEEDCNKLRAINAELLAALKEIAEGCISRPPAHLDVGKNRTKAEIESIALAAIARAEGKQ